jgi:hypothetical protein
MIFVGDWCPLNKHGQIRVREDMILANLEAPILPSNQGLTPTAKAGPNLFSHNLPDRQQPIIFSLANNHIMDYGKDGLNLTISTLESKNYKIVGVGENKLKARFPLIIEAQNRKIGIIGCCEAQFGIAQEKKAGVAEMGAWIYDTIKSLRQETDIIILSVHRAIEDAPWPSPNLQETYRSFIDAGVTVVHGHHAHIPQSIEEYNDGLILYGLGNFLVDPERWKHFPNALWSLGVQMDFSYSPPKWEILTFEIEEEKNNKIHVRESTNKEKETHQAYIDNCNLPLKNSALLNGLWQEVSLRTYFHYKAGYLNFSHGKSYQLNRRQRLQELKNAVKNIGIAIRGSKDDIIQTQWDYLLRYVMFSCDSHRDSIATALGILSGEIEDLRTKQTSKLADEMMPWSVGIVPL